MVRAPIPGGYRLSDESAASGAGVGVVTLRGTGVTAPEATRARGPGEGMSLLVAVTPSTTAGASEAEAADAEEASWFGDGMTSSNRSEGERTTGRDGGASSCLVSDSVFSGSGATTASSTGGGVGAL